MRPLGSAAAVRLDFQKPIHVLGDELEGCRSRIPIPGWIEFRRSHLRQLEFTRPTHKRSLHIRSPVPGQMPACVGVEERALLATLGDYPGVVTTIALPDILPTARWS